MTEPAEAEPAAASVVFGDRLPVVRRFADDLVARGVDLGLIGPREPARVWTRHVLNCGLLAGVLPEGASVADVGSGGGLPGLVLAAARPDLAITLVEPMERRTRWLIDESARLGVEVEVLRARAEEVPRSRRFDVVTARALGALAKSLPALARLAAGGGQLMLMKGAAVEDEIEAAAPVIRKTRLEDVHVEILGTGMATETTRIFRATVP